MCASKAHDRENLGLGGRRVQVSRAWSGKTLSEHSADRATVVREVLAEAGIEAPATDRLTPTSWLPTVSPGSRVGAGCPPARRSTPEVLLGSIKQAQRWRTEYDDRQAPWPTRPGPAPTRA